MSVNKRQVARNIMGTSAEALLITADEAGGQVLPSAFEEAVGDECKGHAAAGDDILLDAETRPAWCVAEPRP